MHLTHPIEGPRFRSIILNCHRLLRHKYRRVPLWALVSDITGFGSTTSTQLCNDIGLDPHQNAGKKCIEP